MDSLQTVPVLGIVIGAIGLIVVLFILTGLKLIRDDQVGIVTKKMFGTPMPPGQVIAGHGQIGVQARTLMPGLYWFMPFIYVISKVNVIEIGTNEIGIVEAIDGDPIPQGRILAEEVHCNTFQDAEAFLFPASGGKRGQKGPQVGIVRPGTYRINTSLFSVTRRQVTKIVEKKLGVVVALDGVPLPSGYIIAPKPTAGAGVDDHNFFQNGQAFLDKGGYRGPQLDTLQPGNYYINPLLFEVKEYDQAEVKPGYVAVLRSNVGLELTKDVSKPAPTGGEPTLAGPVHDAEEVVLNTDQLQRGIYRQPIAPGIYNMNPLAFTPYLVPTSAVTIDWASNTELREERQFTDDSIKGMAQMNPVDGVKAKEFFKFAELTVTSKDGFTLNVDVRLIIRIQPQHAAFVIARFGSVRNLIEQIAHPLIDSSFRNKAGEAKAIEFIQGRTELQQDALKRAQEEFKKYHVDVQNLLIAYIKVDEKLLATQTEKEIAMQQEAQYTQQALAEVKRSELQEKKARADKQSEVVAAKLSIDIEKDKADALRQTAKGERDATKTRADGKAYQEKAVGEGTAAGYKAQSEVLGAGNLAAIKIVEQVGINKVKIVPDLLITGGGSGSGDQSGLLLTGLLSTILADKVKETSTISPKVS
ncbi:MAG: SPFH domain-containing protein [bacterium]|nr:SPFH domain-containing protein [bacterium]